MLKGNQKKLDKNKDGKISGEDFKLMRKPVKAVLGIATMGLLGAKYLSKKKKASAEPKDDSESLLPIEKLEGNGVQIYY